MPVSMPSRQAETGCSPAVVALSAPATAKSASPAASKIRTELCVRSTRRGEKKVMSPAPKQGTRKARGAVGGGGGAPNKGPRTIPPAVAAAKATPSTPKRSSRCLTPASAPLSAKTNVPQRSRTNRKCASRAPSCKADLRIVLGVAAQEAPVLQLAQRLLDLGPRVHDERTVARDRLVQRPRGSQQEATALGAGLRRHLF